MKHILYQTGDVDAPDVIKDRNGEVVLGLCRVCKRAEVQLDEFPDCLGGREVTTPEPRIRPYEEVNHPPHYGGGENPYEVIKVIEEWDLDFKAGNAVKYIARAGKKPGSSKLGDLKKALWYLQRLIMIIEAAQGKSKEEGKE